MNWVLRLVEDVLSPGAPIAYLPAAHRTLLVMKGDLIVEWAAGSQFQPEQTAWLGSDAIAISGGQDGATVYRFELVSGDADQNAAYPSAPQIRSSIKGCYPVALPAGFGWLMRCDQVDLPPGAVAYRHMHQGPGIRCVYRGSITVESEQGSDHYALGDTWLEVGVEPVRSTASQTDGNGFVRCLLLPTLSKNRSSIRYVEQGDFQKPKHQRYKVFGERLLPLGSAIVA